jgi:hypothetical protein
MRFESDLRTWRCVIEEVAGDLLGIDRRMFASGVHGPDGVGEQAAIAVGGW